MVQGYYTLDEAARILGMDPEHLNQMAQKREIRAFADRGTWRFRTQDVEEMARRMGLGSSPELQLGEAERGKPISGVKPKSGPKSPPPKSGPRTPAPKSGPKQAPAEGAFDFSAGQASSEEVEHEIVIESPSSQKLRGKPGSPSPSPKPGSDSDVHLVFDVGGDFNVVDDSDVKLEDSSENISKPVTPRRTVPAPEGNKPVIRKKTMMPPPSSHLDSGVRLVPMEEDLGPASIGQAPPSSGTDSDIRLTPDSGSAIRKDAARPPEPSDHDLSQTTEDINLDEELRKADEQARARKPRSKAKPKSDARKQGITSSADFELAETPAKAPRKGPAGDVDASGTDEIPVGHDDDDATLLGEVEGGGEIKGSTNVAGINLHSPADSGVNLEKVDESSSESLEFELSLEPESTPKPASSSGEIESSGEFELTLEENPGLAPLDEDKAAAAGEKDIFETDFDMPSLEEGSSSDAMPLKPSETELESSDFDLSLGEEESGSQVVALEGEEADEGAATVSYKGRKGAAASDADIEELDELPPEEELEELEGEEGELRPRRTAALVAAPAPWGVLPAAFLIPTSILMFLVTLMSFELLHGMWSYRQGSKPVGSLVRTLASWSGQNIPD